MSSEPTNSHIETFLKEELSKMQAAFGCYATIQVSVSRHLYDSGPAEYQIDWKAYLDGSGHLPHGTEDHSYAEMAAALEATKKERTPEVMAQRLRDQAAEFLRRAAEIDGGAK